MMPRRPRPGAADSCGDGGGRGGGSSGDKNAKKNNQASVSLAMEVGFFLPAVYRMND